MIHASSCCFMRLARSSLQTTKFGSSTRGSHSSDKISCSLSCCKADVCHFRGEGRGGEQRQAFTKAQHREDCLAALPSLWRWHCVSCSQWRWLGFPVPSIIKVTKWIHPLTIHLESPRHSPRQGLLCLGGISDLFISFPREES